MYNLKKTFGKLVAFLAYNTAKSASENNCFIFFQDEIPESVKRLNSKNASSK